MIALVSPRATGAHACARTGNQKGSGTSFMPPYEYKSIMVPAADVKALVQRNAGAKLASPTACPQ